MSAPVIRPLAAVVEEFERAYLVAALRAHGGRKAETATALGVSRKSLWLKMRAYGIAGAEITPPTALPARSADGVCAVAETNAARRVLEAAAKVADAIDMGEIEPEAEDDPLHDLFGAVIAWRRAQAEHANAAVKALAGVTT